MQVSIDVVLHKLESELAAARQQQSKAKMREHLAAVRALCDIVLAEQEETYIQSAPIVSPQRPIPAAPAPVFSPTPVPLKEEGANGGSLLDF